MNIPSSANNDSQEINKAQIADQDGQDGFDIKKFLFTRILSVLPFIILSGLIGLFVAFLVNRYTRPIYSVEATMLLQEEKNQEGLGGGLQSLLFTDSRLIFENSILRLKSYALNENVVKGSDFNVSYFAVGRAVSNEIYGSECPLKIEFDTSSPQPVNTVFVVESVDENSFSILVEQSGISYSLNTQEPVKTEKCTYPTGKKNYGEWIQSSCYKYRVVKKEGSFSSGSKIRVILNKNSDVVKQFQSRLKFEPLSKGSAGVRMSMEGNSREKMETYINKLQDEFMETGLEEKNKIVQGAIKFIESQLLTISDSLRLVEDNIEDFRVNEGVIDLSSQGSLLLSRLEGVLGERTDVQLNISYLNYLKDYLERKDFKTDIIAPSLMGITENTLQNRVEKLVDLQIEFKKIALSSTEQSIIYEKHLTSLNQYSNSLLELVNNVQKSLKLAADDINKRLAKIQSEIDLLPSKEREYFVIERKFKVNEGIYTFLLQRRAELGILKASTRPDNKILDSIVNKLKILN